MSTRLIRRSAICGCIYLSVSSCAVYEELPLSHQNALARAEAMLPAAARVLALNEDVQVHWSKSGDSLWYGRETASGQQYLQVSLPDGKSTLLFDHDRLAAALENATGILFDPAGLGLDTSSFNLELQTVEINVDGIQFRCSWDVYKCESLGAPEVLEASSRSPDGRYDLLRDGYDLRLNDRVNGQTFQLTSDGNAEYYYGADVFLERANALDLDLKPPVVWSADSRWAATIKLEVEGVGRTSILQADANIEGARPLAIPFRFPMLGDEKLPMAELVLVDTHAASAQIIRSEPWPIPSEVPFNETSSSSLGWWSEDASAFFWLQVGRSDHSISLWMVDVKSGKASKILTESSETRVGSQQGYIDPRNTFTLAETDEVVWFSERDGWGHLYLYDLQTSSMKRQLTQGNWLVREVVYVDSDEREIYFTAAGREFGRNPYFRHLYRLSLDGGEPELLTIENADHAIQFSQDGDFFVDSYSRMDTPPVTVVRAKSGELIAELETADLTALLQAGWRFPEPFTTFAADGQTEIYGALFYPGNFDPDRKYAVIEDIYPLTRTPTRFTLDSAQALANLGFLVVTLDARGATGRSKDFHDAGYGLMAGRLDDHVAALHSLAADRPYIDLDRIGLFGHSWGGAAVARAILTYPDFFHVAVSSAGTHDMRIAQGWFAESVVGLSHPDSNEATNLYLAEQLKGKLLLAHGGSDFWTHPAHTLRLAQALLDAGKDFDLVILPERQHNVPSSAHFRHRSWQYFLQHLGSPTRQ